MCCALCAQSCLTLCDPMVCNPPGSSVMEFPRQEFWSGWPLPTRGDLPDPGIELASLTSPALAGRFFNTAPVSRPSSVAISSCPRLKETRANILTKLSLAQPSSSSEIPCSGYPGLVSFPTHVWHSLQAFAHVVPSASDSCLLSFPHSLLSKTQVIPIFQGSASLI